MKDAQHLWKKISADEQLKAQQRAQDKYQKDKESEIAIAKEEGLAEGLEKGAHEKAVETARNMLKDGLTQEVVAKYTGLSIEEVRKLL